MPRTKAFNQEKTLEKAMHLFWQKGFHATTMENLVNHLEINRASIYDTYGNKRDLYDKALNRYREQKYMKVASLLHQHIEIRKGFYCLFEYFVDSAMEEDARGCFLVNSTTELAIADIYIQQKLSSNRSIYENLFVRYMEYGVKQEQLMPGKNLNAIAAYLYSMKCGIKVIAKLDTSKEELMKIVEVCLKTLD